MDEDEEGEWWVFGEVVCLWVFSVKDTEFVVEGFGGGVGLEFRVFFEEGRIC